MSAEAGRFRPGPRVRMAGGSFGVLVALSGEGRLTGESDDLRLRRGDTLIPYADGPLRLHGQIEAIRMSA